MPPTRARTPPRRQVAFNARSAFFTARARKDLVGVARETLANQEKHLAQVQGFVEVGTHPEIDLSQAKADRATAAAAAHQRREQLRRRQGDAQQAMGVERSVDYDLVGRRAPPVEGEDAEVEALIDFAKQSRPEMAEPPPQSTESGAGTALGARHVLAQSGRRRHHQRQRPAISIARTGISAASSP